MNRFLCFAVLVLMGAVYSPAVQAAQSTADTPVTIEQKQALRSELLGEETARATGNEEYVIGHGDLLGVSIYGEGDMAASLAAQVPRLSGPAASPAEPAPQTGSQRGVQVMMDGRISLLHIGDVEVVGMTLTQLADYLKKLYASVYGNPIVTTTLIQSNSQRFTVMGKVNSPGVFHLDFPMSVVQTIARTGGFTEWASGKITVVREEVRPDDQSLFKDNKLDFDYDRFVSGRDLDRNILIRPGDIIIVH